MKTYTVLHRNEALGKTHFVGEFKSYSEAEQYASERAKLTRSFMVYEVWEGNPRAWKKQIGSRQWRGGS